MEQQDELSVQVSLREWLRYTNRPEYLLAMNGVYFVGWFQIGKGDDYPGVDYIVDWWYARNFRMFANVQRVTEEGDRLLVMTGLGHVTPMRHCFLCAPDYEIAEVSEYL